MNVSKVIVVNHLAFYAGSTPFVPLSVHWECFFFNFFIVSMLL